MTTRDPPPRSRIAAAVLAGGRSRRFPDMDKRFIVLPDGRTLLRRTRDELAAAGLDEVLIVGEDTERLADFGAPVKADLHPGLGPVGGVETALHYFRGRAGGVLLLPADLPALTRREIARLAAAFAEGEAPVVVAETEGKRWQPLCAVAEAELADAVSGYIARGVRRVRELWEALGMEAVSFPDPEPFFNVNTPEDWAEWLRRCQGSESHVSS